MKAIRKVQSRKKKKLGLKKENNQLSIHKSQQTTIAVHFAKEDFSDDDCIQAALELNNTDFSDDEHILASI